MRKGQEIHHQVSIAQIEHTFMSPNGRIVHAVGEHNALAQPRGTAGIEDICQIILIELRCTLFYFFLVLEGISQGQELVEIHAHPVLLILLDRAVKDNQSADTILYLQYTVGSIVLVLLTHKDIAHLGIADHILHLRLAAGGIEGDGNGTDSIGTEVHIHTLRHILREDSHILLNANAQFHHGAADLVNIIREGIPRDVLPLILRVVFVLHGCPASVDISLTMNQRR